MTSSPGLVVKNLPNDKQKVLISQNHWVYELCPSSGILDNKVPKPSDSKYYTPSSDFTYSFLFSTSTILYSDV
jgi:hypothetical protein